MVQNIYDFVTEEEAAYQIPIEPIEGYEWGMKDHIRLSALYKNSQFDVDNSNRVKRPFKNIVLPLLNIQYRLTGFDVKDIDIYVSNPDTYYKSLIIKKFHEKWALENGIDTFIDKIVESYVDYGGVLVKNGKELEVVDLQSLAFCDQTDILSGAFAIKHYFTPTQLRQQTAWNQDVINQAILQADYAKKQDKEKDKDKTPTKYIEVYEVHGTFPDSLLTDEYATDDDNYSNQIHIISFYKDSDNNRRGLTFFRKREPTLPFKFLARDGGVFGRALGRGGVEELFESQVWTNYAEQRITRLLDSASKVIYATTDQQFKNKNNLNDLDDNEVLTLQSGTELKQVDSTPRSVQLFQQFVDTRKDNADRISAAGDALQGEQPKSGTPFKLQELVTIENKGLHHWRRGQLAVFLDEIYRDWILPKLVKEILKEQTFLSLLSTDEMIEIAEKVSTNRANKIIKERIFNGELVDKNEIEQFKQDFKQTFAKAGNKRFFKLIENEMSGEKLDVRTNIANKQKNLELMTDKVVNWVRQLIAAPQIRQDPEMIRLTNEILETAGLSPLTYGITQLPATQQGAPNEALQDFANVKENA